MGQDFLKECNTFGVPLEDFQAQFCKRCINPDCTRSVSGTSKFEQRVTNWEEEMFLNVPRMSEGDERFPQIATQRFISLDGGRIPEVGRPAQSAWVDPRDLDVGTQEPQKDVEKPALVVPPENPPKPAMVEQASEPALSARVHQEEKPAMVPPASEGPSNPTPSSFVPMNTPRKSGQMLKGHENPGEKADPWAVPQESTNEGVKIVQPGAKIKFGGSGV